MNKVLIIVSKLEEKVKKLVNLHHEISKENKSLKKEISELKNQIEKQKLIIHRLEEKNKVQKISKSLNSGKDTFNAKIKINELVREIDKCISLLNN
jgi:hypothetical protein